MPVRSRAHLAHARRSCRRDVPGQEGRISFSQFAEQLPNALNVFTVTPFGTGLTLATPFGPEVFTPFSDFSPDGERLAIETSRSGPNQQIWTIRPDGTDARQLTDGPNGVYDPAWTPDGRMLAVDSDFGSGPGIFLIAARTRHGQLLSTADQVRR